MSVLHAQQGERTSVRQLHKPKTLNFSLAVMWLHTLPRHAGVAYTASALDQAAGADLSVDAGSNGSSCVTCAGNDDEEKRQTRWRTTCVNRLVGSAGAASARLAPALLAGRRGWISAPALSCW
jgi:hypothetical protein